MQSRMHPGHCTLAIRNNASIMLKKEHMLKAATHVRLMAAFFVFLCLCGPNELPEQLQRELDLTRRGGRAGDDAR